MSSNKDKKPEKDSKDKDPKDKNSKDKDSKDKDPKKTETKDSKAVDKGKDKDKKADAMEVDKAAAATTTETPPPKKEKTPSEELRSQVLLLEKGVSQKDNRLITRALRVTALRRKLTLEDIRTAIKDYFPAKHVLREKLLNALSHIQDASVEIKEAPVAAPAGKPATDKPATDKPAADKPAAPVPVVPRENIIPETQVFLNLLVVLALADRKHFKEAALTVQELVESLSEFNRRTLDLVSAKVYYFYALIYEHLDRLAEIRNFLLTAHRTACLHHDEPSQAVLTNAILRNYLHYNLYSQADQFRRTTELPESRSTNQHARYLYYCGKIDSIQLHYSEAFANLQQALRKAPQRGAIGFRQQANKLLVIVQLLMGEIPERSIFRQDGLKRSLQPYLQLTKAVRIGDLTAFKDVMSRFKNVFLKDKSYSLIIRLRHNVIKTALRKINLSYSRISFKDICHKLELESEEDAEYIVAKAISDGVIDAVIDRAQRFVFSRENVDIYSTHEPQAAFHKRIDFCLGIHNDAIKALRFPENMHKPAQPANNEPEEFEE